SLVSLARNLDIKTVYMQHASVSCLFPALNFDYAFLDGESAYETYLQCEGNRSAHDCMLRDRKVIFSGQKKELSRSRLSPRPKVVGLAVNVLDINEDIAHFVKKLAFHGVNLK